MKRKGLIMNLKLIVIKEDLKDDGLYDNPIIQRLINEFEEVRKNRKKLFDELYKLKSRVKNLSKYERKEWEESWDSIIENVE